MTWYRSQFTSVHKVAVKQINIRRGRKIVQVENCKQVNKLSMQVTLIEFETKQILILILFTQLRNVPFLEIKALIVKFIVKFSRKVI